MTKIMHSDNHNRVVSSSMYLTEKLTKELENELLHFNLLQVINSQNAKM